MAKSYTNEKVTYTYNPRFRKWEFTTPTLTVVQECRGVEIAHKVARIIQGAMKRCGEQLAKLDGLARANISRVTSH